MKKRGKLIVIDGSDGVGKATQTALLLARLKKEKVPAKTLDFPQYEKNFFGKFIGECLTGEHGDFLGLDAHIASILYACDRHESKKKIEKWLADGYTVILNRYVSSNQMHQGGKIKDSKKRAAFLKWLDVLEHKVFGLPRPDGIMYLDVSLETSLKLIEKRNQQKRNYIPTGSSDQAELNPAYLLDAQKSAWLLLASNKKWQRVECDGRGAGIQSPAIIHERVYACYRALIGKK